MSLITEAIKAAKENYDKKGFEHALRVAQYAIESPLIDKLSEEKVYALALMHDLLEDTDFDDSEVKNRDGNFYRCLMILTKKEDEEYIDYIKNIKNRFNIYPEAYIVKLADMRDHLSQTETLTVRLRDKYLEALPYLL